MSASSVKAFRRVVAALIGAVVSVGCCADADEAWLSRASLPEGVRSLLVVIVDTSAATTRSITVDEPYDPAHDYGAGLSGPVRCDSSRVYWRRGAGPAPDCMTQAGLEFASTRPTSGLQCDAARAALRLHGFFVASRAAQWRTDGSYWSAPAADSAEAVECRADRGLHGGSAGTWYASDGPGGPWRGNGIAEIAWDKPPLADPYVFYGGNYLNYLQSRLAQVERPVADVMLRSLSAALAATAELEVALIRVDPDGPEGGYVLRAPIANPLAAAALQDIAREPASGSAPLAETLAEAALWLSGGTVRFGNDARMDTSAIDPSAPARYLSPFNHACRPVSLAYLTAAAPSDDDLAAFAAGALPRFDELTGGCGANCLAAIGQWIAATDLSDALPGVQRAPTTWIAPEPAPAVMPSFDGSILDPLAFVDLVARSFQHDAAIPAGPQLSAAGLSPFTGDAREPAVVLGLSAPLARHRWVGNLFRYGLRAPATLHSPPILVDRDGAAAIDPETGLPTPVSRSFWSETPDSNLLTGGAAGSLPTPDARRIHANLASPRLLDPANRLMPGNPRLDRATVGLVAADPVSLEEVLAWPASQRLLGDPGIHSPIVVDYPESRRQLVFAATNDGLLHAFDADSGVELWAWMPRELLYRLPDLMRNETTTARSHGIEGPLVLHRHDPNGDGRIDAGEHLWLLFGIGRGGNRYYALDISSADDPVLLWSAEMPAREVEALAEPVVTRLVVEGSGQSDGDWVVLLAGGYDRRFDTRESTGPGAGNSLHALDAMTGRLLWSGGGGGANDLRIPGIYSLPSSPRALDLDGDGYLDRAYLADVTGGVWRMDFMNGQAADELAEARLLARLGTGEQRFYATPDVSIAQIDGVSRIAIAVGSGWRARPRDASIVDRVYTLFDHDLPGVTRVLVESDLFDATDAGSAMPAAAPGWYVRLEGHGPGEKVIGPTVTFDHALRFQTYQPLPGDDSEPCGPPRAVLRMYAMDVRTGLTHATAVDTEEDDAEVIQASGLPVGLRFGFPDRWEETCPGCRPRPFGAIAGETFDAGYAGDPVKTSWRKLNPPPASP